MGVLEQVGRKVLAQISLKLRYGVPKISKNVLAHVPESPEMKNYKNAR